MKVLLLSDINSSHTRKWAMALASNGIDIGIFSLSSCKEQWFGGADNITVFSDGIIKKHDIFNKGILAKTRYIKSLPDVKDALKKFKPDIVHAHYATSYGFLGALSGFHPLIISVWGSDVFDFPNQGYVQKKLLKYNLKKADLILSTSIAMAKETKKYTAKKIQVIPFGVDLDVFKPKKINSLFDENDIVIGTVKTLEAKYGIEYLIKAFKILIDKYPDLALKLLIVGGGTQEKYLKDMVKKLNIEQYTIFTGKVDWKEVPEYQNMLYISVSVSESESFGVAVVEASACEKPVVVSNAGGLPEVVEDGVTGFVVPRKNPEKTAEAIEKLILDKTLCREFGKRGREKVIKNYDIRQNIEKLFAEYNNLMQ